MQKSITKSPQETQHIAAELAQQILHRKPGKKAVVLALQGDLGAGKTTFVQGFAKGLGIKEKILSPTFTIMKKFQIVRSPTPHHFKNFYHIDCYRLENGGDLEILGFKEIVKNPENIVAIEWPERIKKILPKNIISITFNHVDEDKRELTLKT